MSKKASWLSAVFQNRRATVRRRKRGPAWWKEPQWQLVLILSAAVLLSSLVFSGVLLIDASNTQNRLMQSKQYIEEGKVAWAATQLERLTEENPTHYEAWIYLGQCYLELNELEKAENAFQSAMAIRTQQVGTNPKEKDVLGRLAESKILRIQHRYKEAESILLDLYERHPQSHDLRVALWDVYYQWGMWVLETEDNPEKALNLLQEAQPFITRFRYDVPLQKALAKAVQERHTQMVEENAPLPQQMAFLKESLSYHYSHETLSTLADLEMRLNHPTQSFVYLENAYALKPDLYALRYLQTLQERLNLAQAQGNRSTAYRLQLQVKGVQNRIKQSKNQIPYPVAVSLKQFDAFILDKRTGEWRPHVLLHLSNAGNAPIPFIKLKCRLYSDKDTLQVYYQRLEAPLPAHDKVRGIRPVSLPLNERYMVQRLHQGVLSLEVFASFEESEQGMWFPIYKTSKTVVNPKQWELPNIPWESKPKPEKTPSRPSTLPSQTI
jgi:tetratricopeptide (TPR) repeat protein